MLSPNDKQLLEVSEDFNKKMSQIKVDINYIELLFDRVLHNFQMVLDENESLKKEVEKLQSIILPTKSPIDKEVDEDKEEYTDEEDKVFNEWKESFRKNLEIAAKIYESWTPEQKIYNSIGYPNQNFDDIPDEYKSYYERD